VQYATKLLRFSRSKCFATSYTVKSQRRIYTQHCTLLSYLVWTTLILYSNKSLIILCNLFMCIVHFYCVVIYLYQSLKYIILFNHFIMLFFTKKKKVNGKDSIIWIILFLFLYKINHSIIFWGLGGEGGVNRKKLMKCSYLMIHLSYQNFHVVKTFLASNIWNKNKEMMLEFATSHVWVTFLHVNTRHYTYQICNHHLAQIIYKPKWKTHK
jgi:hypothetical protein